MLRTIDLYEQLSYFEASKDFASELEALYRQLSTTRKNLDQQIVGLLNNLQSQIMNEKLPSKQGFFTGVHRWWKNLFGGHKNRSNPYYWQNKIGALGRTDLDPPTVREYTMLKTLATELWEDTRGASQPLIRKILTDWGQRLRQTISASLNDMMNRVREMSARVSHDAPAPTPEKPPTPAESPPTDPPDEDDAGPGDAGDTTPEPEAEPEEEEESIDKQAERFKIFKDTRTDFGVWGKLDDSTKRLILNACKTGSCPKGDAAEDKYPIREIHTATNKYLSLVKSTGTKGDAWKGLSTREQEILQKIHEPWNKLGRTRRNLHNNRGNDGKKISSRSQTGPFTLPTVVRIDDPRHEILKKYYPELFQHLDLAGRVERRDDTEASVRERILKLLRKGKEEGAKVDKGKTDVRDAEEVHDMPDEDEKEVKKHDYGDVRMAPTHSDDDDLDDNPDTAAVEERLYQTKYEDFSAKLGKIVKTDRDLVRRLLDVWDSLGDSKTLKKKFLKMVEAGNYKEIESMTSEKKKKKKGEEDDDEVKKHFGESRQVTEAFKTNLDSMKRGMRLLSKTIYQES